jgi:hypothetical protein
MSVGELIDSLSMIGDQSLPVFLDSGCDCSVVLTDRGVLLEDDSPEWMGACSKSMFFALHA